MLTCMMQFLLRPRQQPQRRSAQQSPGAKKAQSLILAVASTRRLSYMMDPEPLDTCVLLSCAVPYSLSLVRLLDHMVTKHVRMHICIPRGLREFTFCSMILSFNRSRCSAGQQLVHVQGGIELQAVPSYRGWRHASIPHQQSSRLHPLEILANLGRNTLRRKEFTS